MTRLRDLDPELFGAVEEGKLYLDCPFPACERGHRVCVMVSSKPYHERPSEHDPKRVVKVWQASGEFPDTLTLTPSVDLIEADENGKKIRTLCWHGHITNGAVT